MKKILVVDDHAILREALLLVIKDNMPPGGMICDDVESVFAARNMLEKHKYDLIVLDIAMPKISGIDFLPELKSKYPDTPVLMLSMYPEEQFALQSLRLGASGYLAKHEAAEEFFAAIELIMNGGKYLSRSFSSMLIDRMLQEGKIRPPSHDSLSPRELEILKLLSTGMSLKNAGDRLGLSIKTVSTYKTRLCSKMGFKNNAELLSYGINHNLG